MQVMVDGRERACKADLAGALGSRHVYALAPPETAAATRLQEATTVDDDIPTCPPTQLHAASPRLQLTEWPCARPSDGHWATLCVLRAARDPLCAPLQPPRCGRRRSLATARKSPTYAYAAIGITECFAVADMAHSMPLANRHRPCRRPQ